MCHSASTNKIPILLLETIRNFTVTMKSFYRINLEVPKTGVKLLHICIIYTIKASQGGTRSGGWTLGLGESALLLGFSGTILSCIFGEFARLLPNNPSRGLLDVPGHRFGRNKRNDAVCGSQIEAWKAKKRRHSGVGSCEMEKLEWRGRRRPILFCCRRG